MQADIFVDPSAAGPDVLFSTGQVVDGAETFASGVPDILGSPDPGWNITQWNTPADQIVDPATVVRGDPADADPVLGSALASWHTGTAEGGSALVVYGQAGNVTFQLGATGGDNRDTFLQSTGYAPGTVTFDTQISFTAQERLVQASAGTGTAIAFNGFTVFFNASGNPSYDASLPQTELFLQVPLTDFRGAPGPYTTITAGDTYQQIYNVSSQSYAADGTLTADESADYLGFSSDDGALHTVSIDLNQALLRMVDLMAAQNPAMASAYLDLSRWSLGSVYAGVETGGGDGANAASLTLDVAHPVLTQDGSVTVSSATPLSTVQSIDGGGYAETEDASVITTPAGSTDTIRLSGTLGAQTLTSNGADTVLVGDGDTATLHGLGATLAVESSVAGGGNLTIDGTATLTASGVFGTLSVQGSAANETISGTVLAQASLALAGEDASVSLNGTVNATLSGADAHLSADGGQVVLGGDDAAIDQNGGGSQSVLLGQYDASITQSGLGTQTLTGLAVGGGSVSVSGGGGQQILWTGDGDATVAADGTGMLAVHVQAGSTSLVDLGGETTLLDGLGGSLTAIGGAASGSVSLFATAGSDVYWGGAETLNATLVGTASLQIGAGSGAQTIFGGPGALTAIGSHSTDGSQIVVNGDAPGASSTIFGGRTDQTVWTGEASDTIVSSVLAGDASGRIDAYVQGGVSTYWGGVESATLDNQGGILDAFLAGGGAVSILAEMTGRTSTTLAGFDSRLDSLTLAGVSSPAGIAMATTGGNTMLSFAGSQVMLDGLTHVALTQSVGGVAVTGWS